MRIISILAILCLFCSEHITSLANTEKTLQTKIAYIYSDEDDFAYVRELRNGIWWIIVYDSDGKVVNEYPDPIQ